ncbi:uncharacterized protein kif16bb isoform X2 [Myripristis murdjan]|uniref:uncharacterized protein kif16bb isoform X2 n=1 Tax=Myripristis murdjan TaxID=586833 RepID=UPI0011762496|nr:uncharacterized protein LOC115372641 isoform X2 [Myripristis murdjan]
MASVRVAVRVRPLSKREKQLASKVIIHTNGHTATIVNTKLSPSGILRNGLKERGKSFSFDFSYDSSDRGNPSFASQEKIFQDLGAEVLKAVFEGFNACVFAYGQTGTGKSYTMMGHTGDKGLIPRICEGLFCEMSQRNKSDELSFRTEVSYLEIYNERVQDLLQRETAPVDSGGLRVREHPRDGPYVENLSKHLVHSHSDMEELIILGNANRTTASTGMNDVSSRSHAIFTISFTQARFDAELPCEMLSKIHLVDLAGSERADATRTTGTRLKEGANINKSLVTLGSVISALADLSEGGQTAKKKHIFVPYRNSVLTWLLKDSLGGNSKTIMIAMMAAISPADVNYAETLSTLRYASRAKAIVNSPVVNEDCSVRLIRELQAEIARLQRLIEEASQVSRENPTASLKVEERLHQNEAKEETLALRKEGSGVILDCQLPHLIGIDEDLLSTGIILYHLKEGRTLIGRSEASCRQDIALHGPGLLSEHCVLENCAGTVSLIPQSGALCSVNGTAVTHPCTLTQGAILQLGRGTMFRFNHPVEAAQLREKRKRGLLSAFSLSMTDMSKSTENLSRVMLLNPSFIRRLEEKHSQEEVEWQHVQDSLRRHIQDIKTPPRLQRGTPDQQRAGEETEGREMDETSCGMDRIAAVTADSRLPSSSAPSASPEKCMTMDMPGKCPVSHASFEVDGDTLQGGISTRDGQEQERDSSHKSGPGLMSERLWKRGEIGARIESYGGGGLFSGDASLQQTSVLGLGDGCGVEPEGNANKSHGVVADGYKGSTGSSGSSLGSVSHLQSTGGDSFRSVLPLTSARSELSKKTHSAQAACCPPEETVFEDQSSCEEIDESRGSEEILGECEAETAAQNTRQGSLVNRVSWMVQEAASRGVNCLWSSPMVLQQVREEGLQPVGARWYSQVVSLVRGSQVLSAVKESHVLSLVKESHIFSLLKDSYMFSLVKELPLIQYIKVELTQNCQPEEVARTIQANTSPDTALTNLPAPSRAKAVELSQNPSQVQDVGSRDQSVELKQQDMADIHLKQGESVMKELAFTAHRSPKPKPQASHTPVDKDLQTAAEQSLRYSVTMQMTENVQNFCQKLVEFPDALANLQSLPLREVIDSLQSVISTSVFTSQRTVALYWLRVAKCSQPQPCPALLILKESGLYTLTSDPGCLVLFHHLPLLQLKEIQIGLAGQTLRLMGTTEESILGIYTHSQKLTKELCRAILDLVCLGDSRVSQHPLLQGDLKGMSLGWQAYIPDLLLDAGLRVCCQFQKTLADLVYLLHGNMGNQEKPSMGQVRLLLYSSVRLCISPNTDIEPLAQLVLTDTHLGLVQEDIIFHPAPCSVHVEPRNTQFRNLTLRPRSDVRCVLVHDVDKIGSTRLDVFLATVGAKGHPERVTKAAIPPVHASNSSPHAEVWKLTFGCSTEAACLINHLSDV